MKRRNGAVKDKYVQILEDFMAGKINIFDLQSLFINKFKSEDSYLDDILYEILEEIFGILDSMTDDSDLLENNGMYYINISEAKIALNNLYNQLIAY